MTRQLQGERQLAYQSLRVIHTSNTLQRDNLTIHGWYVYQGHHPVPLRGISLYTQGTLGGIPVDITTSTTLLHYDRSMESMIL